MVQRKLPFRPGNEICQSFNDGVATVYRLVDTAKPGYLPKPEPVKTAVLRYEEQRLGLTRYYAAQQNNVDVERVVRVPRGPGIAVQDIAVTEDGQEYAIGMVQTVEGVFPPCLDVTLAKVSQKRVTAGASDSDAGKGAAE